MVATVTLNLGNCVIQSAKTGLLSNPSQNLLYITALAGLCTVATGSKPTRLALLIALSLVKTSSAAVPALSNTLFLVHPVALYTGLLLLAFGVRRGKGTAAAVFTNFCILAVVLGGY